MGVGAASHRDGLRLFKVGQPPGVVLFLDADSEEDVEKLIDSLPIVEQGLLTFDLEPTGLFMHL